MQEKYILKPKSACLKIVLFIVECVVRFFQMKTNYKMASAVLCVDCYDIARDQWTVFCSPKLTSVTAATSHVLGDAIYILGGERPAVDGFSSSKISCFNTEDNKFQTSHRHEIPKRCSRHASGLLILPKLKL